MPLSPVAFKECWDEGHSVTHVAHLLRHLGWDVTPRKVLAYAWTMRAMGVGLKRIPRPRIRRPRRTTPSKAPAAGCVSGPAPLTLMCYAMLAATRSN